MFAASVAAADFGSKGGPEPANIDEIADVLRQDPYDMELLISFGTSKGGSAGHLALAIRDQVPGDDLVCSANFYADRTPEHEGRFYTDDLMVRIPKKEYLFGTDLVARRKGLVRPRLRRDLQAIGHRRARLRRAGPARRRPLAAFFSRINDDYHRRARKTEYHDREIKYDYLHLNCAKTIGAGIQVWRRVRGPGGRPARSFCRRARGWWRRPTPTFPPRWR
ncbi:MAG: hypothetical protein MZW92_64950 [Comamonadaceae bacterium]|nr:hypothetical protein [Comamonadaceae bacterium]